MELERIRVVLRPRVPREALDLGAAMLRANARAVWSAWFAFTLPLFVLCNALGVLLGLPWLGWVLIWWLRPLFDRLPLYVLSRAAPAAGSARGCAPPAACVALAGAASADRRHHQHAYLRLPAVRAGAVPERVAVRAPADPARVAAAVPDRAAPGRRAARLDRVDAGRRERGLPGHERDRAAVRRLRFRLVPEPAYATGGVGYRSGVPSPARATARAGQEPRGVAAVRRRAGRACSRDRPGKRRRRVERTADDPPRHAVPAGAGRQRCALCRGGRAGLSRCALRWRTHGSPLGVQVHAESRDRGSERAVSAARPDLGGDLQDAAVVAAAGRARCARVVCLALARALGTGAGRAGSAAAGSERDQRHGCAAAGRSGRRDAQAVARAAAARGAGPVVSRLRGADRTPAAAAALGRCHRGRLVAPGCGDRGSGARATRHCDRARLAIRGVRRALSGRCRHREPAQRLAGAGGGAAMNRRPLYLGVLVLAVVLLLVVGFFATFEHKDIIEATPAHGEARYNRFFALDFALNRLGLRTRPLTTLDRAKLPLKSGDTLLLGATPARVEAADAARIAAWVRGGGHLLLSPESASAARTPLFNALGLLDPRPAPYACSALHVGNASRADDVQDR